MDAVDSAGRKAGRDAGRDAARATRRTARRAATSRPVDRFARLGLACRGLLYGLIGLLALQIAFGDGDRQADGSGAIAAVAGEPFGGIVLWLLLVGFAALALWQAAVALIGSGGPGDRWRAAGRTVFYGFLAVMFASVVLGGSAPRSGDQTSRDLTTRLLGVPGGQLLVGAAGVAVIGLGGYWLYKGVSRGFLDELRTWRIPPGVQRAVETVGVIGHAARGVVAGMAGAFLVQAAVQYEPDKAKGVDATLRSFAGTTLGPWLLAAVAAGVLCFAAYCLCEVRWRRV